MQPTNYKRFYSPQFSEFAAVSVRRLAWALGKPMPKAVDHLVRFLPSVVDPAIVCLSCRDQSMCHTCIFKSAGESSQQGAAAIEAAL